MHQAKQVFPGVAAIGRCCHWMLPPDCVKAYKAAIREGTVHTEGGHCAMLTGAKKHEAKLMKHRSGQVARASAGRHEWGGVHAWLDT